MASQVFIPRLVPRNSDPTRRYLAYGKQTVPNLVGWLVVVEVWFSIYFLLGSGFEKRQYGRETKDSDVFGGAPA